jgi:hypothetical protein
MEKIQLNDNGNFKLIIWGYSVEDIKDIETLTYRQLISKHIPGGMLSDKYIARYYWDEQLIEYEYYRIKEETGKYFPMSELFFSIVLNNKIILHGICRTMSERAIKIKYDDSNYPAIVSRRCSNPGNWILALKPRYYPIDSLFRDYDEEEQKRLLNQEVLKYFEAQGKIVRGKMDLNKLFGRNQK